MQLKNNQYIYFASDFHLGAPNAKQSLEREKKVVAWLNQIKPSCAALYLMGDVFDFWFDYGKVIPKGFSRLLGKLAELRDEKIPVYFFTGNHDLWMFNYLEDELNIPIIRNKIELEIENKKLFLAHGDGLGPNDKGYKRLKKVFTNPVLQFMFKWFIHPNIGIWVAQKWSTFNKPQYKGEVTKFLNEEEWLVQYARRKLEKQHYDYFVFGHRHAPIIYKLNENSKYVNLGDWINHFTYAKFDGKNMELLTFE